MSYHIQRSFYHLFVIISISPSFEFHTYRNKDSGQQFICESLSVINKIDVDVAIIDNDVVIVVQPHAFHIFFQRLQNIFRITLSEGCCEIRAISIVVSFLN